MSVGKTDPVTEDRAPSPRKSGRLQGWIGGWGAIGPGKALHSSCRSAQGCSLSSPGAFHLQRVTRTNANEHAGSVLKRSLVKKSWLIGVLTKVENSLIPCWDRLQRSCALPFSSSGRTRTVSAS